MRRRGGICKQLLDDLNEKRGHWKPKKEALDRPPWRTRFGSGYGPVVREYTELIIIIIIIIRIIIIIIKQWSFDEWPLSIGQTR